MNKAGRPLIWTEEKLRIEADLLVEWANREDSLVMGEYYGMRGYTYDDAREWSLRSDYYNHARLLAKTIIGARREKGALLSTLDSAMVRSTMANYDPDHRELLKEMKREQVVEDLKFQEVAKNLSDKLKSQPQVSNCG